MPNAPAESSSDDTALLDLFTAVEGDVAPAAKRVLGTRAQRHSRRFALITMLDWRPVWFAMALVAVLLAMALWSSLLSGTDPARQRGSSSPTTHVPAIIARPVGPPATAGGAGPADAAHAPPMRPGSVTGPTPEWPARTASGSGAARVATTGGPSATGDERRQERRQGGKPPWAGSGRQKARDERGHP